MPYATPILLCSLLLLACSEGEDALPRVPSTEGVDCEVAPFDEDLIAADLAYLASPELDGRVPGTEGDEAARAVVEERFACLGLSPLLPADAYQEPFTDASDRETANVIAAIRGSDASLNDEVILLSAHLDHLGDGLLGANDNASGLSGLLAIAAAMSKQAAPSRTVVFAAFGSEESGFEGSEAFYTSSESSTPATDIVFSLNMDMVGTYDQTDTVYALGTLPGTPGRTVIDALAGEYSSLDVGVGDWSDQSDNVTFCSRGVPYIFMWTEDPDCYHEACDTEDRIDYSHMVDILRLTADATSELASTDADLAGAVDRGRDVCVP